MLPKRHGAKDTPRTPNVRDVPSTSRLKRGSAGVYGIMPTPPAAPKYLGCMLQRLAGKSQVVHGQSVIRSEFFVSLFLAASCSILLRQQPTVVSLAPCIVYHKASPPRTPKSIPRVRPCLVSLHPFVRGTRHRAPPRPRPRGESRDRPKFYPGSVYRLSRSLALSRLRVAFITKPRQLGSPNLFRGPAQKFGLPSHFTLQCSVRPRVFD